MSEKNDATPAPQPTPLPPIDRAALRRLAEAATPEVVARMRASWRACAIPSALNPHPNITAAREIQCVTTVGVMGALLDSVESVPALLDLLSAAESRATTAEAEAERLKARLACAHAFWLVPGDHGPRIGIESRQQRDLSIKWGVAKEYPRVVLNKSGEWEHEPIPSDRTDEFIAATRFDTLDAAFAAAESAAQATKQGGA